MANAEKIYVDPSALRRLYVHDSHSHSFCTWRAKVGGGLPLSMHGRAELVNSIALAVFRKDLPSNAGDAAIADLHADLAAGRLFLADVPWRRTFDRATELSCANTPRFGTRTLDVLHVATATVIGCTSFVTYDTRQAKLARAVGLRTTAP